MCINCLCYAYCVESGLHIVLIGLGGGGLPMFLHNSIAQVFYAFCLVYCELIFFVSYWNIKKSNQYLLRLSMLSRLFDALL